VDGVGGGWKKSFLNHSHPYWFVLVIWINSITNHDSVTRISDRTIWDYTRQLIEIANYQRLFFGLHPLLPSVNSGSTLKDHRSSELPTEQSTSVMKHFSQTPSGVPTILKVPCPYKVVSCDHNLASSAKT